MNIRFSLLVNWFVVDLNGVVLNLIFFFDKLIRRKYMGWFIMYLLN